MSNPFQPWKSSLSVIQSNTSDFYQNVNAKSNQSGNQICDNSMPVGQDPNFATFASSSSSSNNNNNHLPMTSASVQSTSNSQLDYTANKATTASNLLLHKMNSENNKFGVDFNFLNGDPNAANEAGKMDEMISNAIGDHAKQQILKILENISYLKPPEKLLLYLRLPGGYPETDPLRQSQNPLGTRSEINHTINWVRSHLEVDPSVSIPKQDVYEDYVAYCTRCDIKPLSTADFGKVMKQVFPGLRPRRLGTRGNSRYCYAAMRKATKLDTPKLPELSIKKNSDISNVTTTDDEGAWKTIKNWAETLLGSAFESMHDLADHITDNNLCSLANNTSRQLLKKKIMQREAKDRKNNNKNNPNDSSLKRRRKKRKKSLSTSLISSTTEFQQQNSITTNNVDNASGDSNSQQSLQNDDCVGGGGGGDDDDGLSYDEDRKNALKKLLIEANQQQQQLLPINLITNNTTTNSTNNNNNVVNNKISEQVAKLIKKCANKNDNLRDIDENSVDSLIINNSSNNNNHNNNRNPTKTTIHGTNLVCDNNGVLNSDEQQQQQQQQHHQVYLKQQQQLLAAAVATTTASLNLASDNSVSNNNNNNISLHDAELQNIFCKKVRQAQQAKGKWLHLPATTPGGSSTDLVTTTSGGGELSKKRDQDQLVQITDGLAKEQADGRTNPNKTLMLMPRVPPKRRGTGAAIAYAQRMKKPKAGTPNNPEAVLNAIKPSDLVVKKDDIRGECIIPRERFISICNMDKDALDSYLVGEDNSQEQEAELLQIFQQPDEQGNQQKSGASSVSEELENSGTLDHFAMYGECKQEKLSDGDENDGKIMQLRSLLETNMSKKTETVVSNNDNLQMNLYPGSASASLAMLSQRHNMPAQATTTSKNRSMPTTPANIGSAARKLNVDGPFPGAVGQNSNRTFVPITANRMLNSQIKNQNIGNTNLFVSPRATPIVRRVQRNFGGLHTLNMSQIGQKVAIGAQNTAFSRPQQQFKTEFPASAPPSPSPMMAAQQCYSNRMPSVNNLQFSPGGNMMSMQQMPHQSQQQMDMSTLECRSQSVPLHARSPTTMFNHNTNMNYSAYSSANNSVSQTPVPSEYNDFNDTNLLDMFAEQEMPTSVKIESDVISEFLDDDEDAEYFGIHSKNAFNTSRSVPATPLPHYNANHTNSFDFTGGNSVTTKTSNYLYDASKSVPTTPIQHHHLATHTQHQSRFRFSPDLLTSTSSARDIVNRDFLINGNSVDQGKMTAYYNQQQQQQQVDPIVDKDLSTISDDIDFSSDPIIGNDILSFK